MAGYAAEIMAPRRKFASQADAALLTRLRKIARDEGRHFQAVLEEAMQLYIEHRGSSTPRARVIAQFRASVARNRRLGELLSR
jgi:hypothetical protein